MKLPVQKKMLQGLRRLRIYRDNAKDRQEMTSEKTENNQIKKGG
jgi:hypothetical protein